MTISQFSKAVDDVLQDIDKLYQQTTSNFDPNKYTQAVSQLQKSFDDIKPVSTKDEQGNPLTDEDGKKIFSSADLLALDRQHHLQDIAKQKLILLNKLALNPINKQEIEDLHKAYNHLQAKEEFFAGRGEQLSQRLDATKTPDGEVALVYGPLNKNMYTEQFENLVKGMIRGQDFTLSVNADNEHVVRMNGKTYNLTQILKYANLTHLTFDKKDCENYLEMLATKQMAYRTSL